MPYACRSSDPAEKLKEKAIFISFGILDDYVVLNGRLDGKLICNDFNVYRGINTIKIK